MTTPTFPLETALGWFSLTVVDERCIIARVPASGQAMLMIDGNQFRVQAALRPDEAGVWRPSGPNDLLVVRRDRSGGRVSPQLDQHLYEMIVDTLAQAVTAWISEYPILLATAAAFNRDAALHRARRVTIERVTTKE